MVQIPLLPQEVKILISSCSSPGGLAIQSCERMFCAPIVQLKSSCGFHVDFEDPFFGLQQDLL
jgi:hypothetical protein